MEGSERACSNTDCDFNTQPFLWILSGWAVTCLWMDKIAAHWRSVLLLIVSSRDKYVLCPFEPAPTSQELPAGPALGSFILICIRTWGRGIYCVSMCWLVLIRHAVESPNSTPMQPQGNDNSISTTSSIICWRPSLIISGPVVGENWVRCLWTR